MKIYLLPILAVGMLTTAESHAAEVSYGLTLDGKYTDYRQDPEEYELPGLRI